MKLIKLWHWDQRLQVNLGCFCKSGKLQRGFALDRHRKLQWQYLDDLERWYQPPSERRMLSRDSLYLFPEAQLLADEAKYSISQANYVEAHVKMDRAFEVLREAGHLRFHDMMRYHARQRKQA